MDYDTYQMAITLLNALATANSIEQFSSNENNVYGDIETALGRLGPEAGKLYTYWCDTNEIILWADLWKSNLRYLGDPEKE